MLKIFSIFDSKAQYYSNPFYAKTSGEAVRSFTDLVNDSRSTVSRYPADFVLFELGSFDEVKAEFKMLTAPHSLGVGIEFVSNTPVSSFGNVDADYKDGVARPKKN